MRPALVTNEYLEYLDDLRESGVTNMFGARPYLERRFNLPPDEAKVVLLYWMESFDKANR